MSWKRLLCTGILAVAVAAPAQASAQQGGEVIVTVDSRAPTGPLERIWAFHGYDEANYTTTSEGTELLRALAAAHSAPPRIRTHFLFNTGDAAPALKWGSTNIYTEDAQGGAVYDFTVIDSILDATLEAGARPLLELGFMPQALSVRPDPYRNSDAYTLDGGCFYPPRDYEKWAALVRAYAAHVKDRYPNAGSSFEWELWNEPDIGYWKGTFEEFARLYDYTEAALHAVLPDASLGGPAVASVGTKFLDRFLEHCATGTNAVTGEVGTRLDMVSFHAKGGVSASTGFVRMNLRNQLSLHRTGFDVVAASAFARTPIVLTEADPDGCAACPESQVPANAYRNSPAYGAYVAAMMKRSLDLANIAGVDLRGIVTWAFTFPGAAYFAGYRELATNGIHLPVFNAFKLLGQLEGDRLSVTSTGARPLDDILVSSVRALPDVDAIASIEGNRIQILVWNYHDDIVEAPPASVALRVAVPDTFGAKAAVTHTRLDHDHGDAFRVWVAQGRPAAPSETQLSALRNAMEPVVLERGRGIAVANGEVAVSFELPRFGLSLFTLEPARSLGPEPRQGDAGCSCRAAATNASSRPLGLVLALTWAFAQRRRRARASATRSRPLA